MHTIVELPEYSKRVEKLLDESESKSLIDFLAREPTAGVIVTGTGGIRKLRWARGSQGKSGGVRVIYYYHNADIPLFLLTLFGKNEKSDLSKAEQSQLMKLTTLLKNYYGG